jgi:hypothetical protein
MMATVRLTISVLEWPPLVRLFSLPEARARYPDFYAALYRSVLSLDLPRDTAVAVHGWLREHAMTLGSSARPRDRTDGLHIRNVAETIERALKGSIA